MEQRSTDRRGLGSMEFEADMRPNRTWGRGRTGRGRGVLVALALAVASSVAMPAEADDYDPKDAGHPLRIVAYVLHPVGVVFDYLVMRPAHWLGSQEPLKTFFGHED